MRTSFKAMMKKTGLALASLFLTWRSYILLGGIQFLETDSWLLFFFIGFVINLYITGIFAFAGFAFPTQKLMPATYYRIRNPKRLKKMFKALKVELFRKFLLATFWKSQKQRQKYFNGKKEGIYNLVLQSKKSEFGHLLPFVFITLICIYLMAIGLILLSIFTLAINIFGNFYPIILQRHHRMRIQLIQQRLK